DQARENERLAAAHLRDVNDAQLPLGERVNQHVHKLAALVMQHLHDRCHVASGGQSLGLLPLRIKVEQSADIVKRRGVAVGVDQVDQRLPPVLRKPAQLPNVLLLLTFVRSGGNIFGLTQNV